MDYRNEVEIKQALGIESWRNLSKDKLIRFAAMMPNMDTQVALKVIEQFPAFKDFAVDVVETMEQAQDGTLSANASSQDHVHEAYADIRGVIKGELTKDDLSWEQKKWLIEQLQETAAQDFKKDSENKRFLDGVLNKVLVGAGGALIAGLVFVGAKGIVESENGGDSTLA